MGTKPCRYVRFETNAQHGYDVQHHVDGWVDPATFKIRKPFLGIANQACGMRLRQAALLARVFYQFTKVIDGKNTQSITDR